jgi:hypothetical protein
MKELIFSTLSGFVGALVAVFASYYYIEQPKIELEQKKVALEAQRQTLLLVPQIESSCSSTRLDLWKWRIDCHSTNKGQYPAIVAIHNTTIQFVPDQTGFAYDAGSGFKTDYPNNKNMFLATANAQGGDLYFYLLFDKVKYPTGVARTDIVARVEFSYKSPDSVVRFVNEKFPEVSKILMDLSNNGAFVDATSGENLPHPDSLAK